MKFLFTIVLILTLLNEVSVIFLPHGSDSFFRHDQPQESKAVINQLFHPITVSDGRTGRYCRCPFNSSYNVSPFDIAPVWIIRLTFKTNSFGTQKKETVIRPALILNEYYIFMKKDYIQYLLRGDLNQLLKPTFTISNMNPDYAPVDEEFHVKKYVEYPGNRILDFVLAFLSNDLILIQLDRPITFSLFQHKKYGLGPACFRSKRTANLKKRNIIKTDMISHAFFGEFIKVRERKCLMPNALKEIVKHLKMKIPKLVCRDQNSAAVKKAMNRITANETLTSSHIEELKISNIISLKESGYMRHIGFCPALHNSYLQAIEMKTPPYSTFHFHPARLICLSLSPYENWLIENMADVECQLYSTMR